MHARSETGSYSFCAFFVRRSTPRSATDSIARALLAIVAKLLRGGNSQLGGQVTGTVVGPAGRLVPWSLSLLAGVASGPVALVQFHVTPTVQITAEAGERLGLTPRQAMVAEMMANGRTYREIATALGIRPNTARRHWEQVLQRLGIRSRAEVRDVVSRTSV